MTRRGSNSGAYWPGKLLCASQIGCWNRKWPDSSHVTWNSLPAMEGEAHSGLRLIGKLPAAQCPQFFHKVIDGVCGRAQPRFQDYGNIWSLQEWLEVLEDSTAFFKNSIGADVNADEVSNGLNVLSAEHQEVILKCLKSRKPDIAEAVVEKACAMSSAYLQDFDWQLKVLICCSIMEKHRPWHQWKNRPLP
ncbi:hypothetical protein XENTR_v10000512 [Xenopus tropicalis]|uniref:COMM domain-containing protein 8 isoform X1 n=1 Tax=Xenopus tropicalis TaxID=8364 RepID=A0A8J0T247_XENTR|nr:COMM domain-containing protein 8 isoform X1 [Xenopus tropicalis]KAE8629517.1 hypothetical protein XENTR_v10000512 [Xenopus tropicalis]